jgi:hypothetical protein
MKFGSVDNLALTGQINSYLPALVADHFTSSRIVAFSTGVSILSYRLSGGSVETDLPEAVVSMHNHAWAGTNVRIWKQQARH